MNKQQLIAAFADKFAGANGNVYASPGRINLIGEHTDYNGGFVFPGGVEQGIMAVIRPNDTDTIRALSLDLNEYGEWPCCGKSLLFYNSSSRLRYYNFTYIML